MFVKTVLRAAVMPAVVTGLVGASLAASPSLVTSAPELRQVDHPYESTVSTTTDVSLDRGSIGEFGQANGATVTVTPDEGDLDGRIRIRVVGVDSWTVPAGDGTVSVDFPRRLPANETYTVEADYLPGNDSNFIASTDTIYYTVKPVRTSTTTRAGDIRVREVAKARVRVEAASGLTPPGTVRAVLTRNGNRIAVDRVRLEDGVAVARFGRITRRGTYDVRASYNASNDNFRNSSDAVEFAARRR